MKYFAKYLPVKGEIKEGDKGVMLLKNNIPTYHKLFLCSRDIQVGDEAYIESRNFQAPTYLVTGTDFNPRWSYANVIKNSFKVIGEISPKATWVKEGDEFDESDINLVPKGEKISTNKNLDGTYNVIYDFKTIAKIKGPCGHFH